MRTIGKDEIEALKRGIDLAALVREHGVELKRTGKTYSGRCPFHDDKNPSFVVDPARNLWKCFGACASNGKSGGDAIAFLMKKEGLSFTEALDRLVPGTAAGGTGFSSKSPASAREKAEPGASPEPSPASSMVGDVDRSRLLGEVVTHYQAVLARSPRAQGYLKQRGLLVPEVLRAVRAGYADGSLLKAIAAKGETRDLLGALGVLNEEGREVLTGTVVVPLLDPKTGAVVSLYGRSVTGRRHHYLKGELRGLVNATAARSAEDLVLVESVLDALSLTVLGVHNVLPLYGTNGWTKDHEQLLEQSAVKGVTLLLDGDEAGKRAAEALAEKLSRRGLGVRIAMIPGHKDPNEALVAGVTGDQLREILEQAAVIAAPPLAVAAVPAGRPATTYEVEDIEGGFLLTIGARRYRARGIAGGAYERLRLNLKLEDAYGSYVDTLDLYVARARRGFVLRAAKVFHLDEETVERELGLLVEVAESWIASRAKEEEGAAAATKRPELSDQERAEALDYLKKPKLLERVVADLGQLGYVGEETNKALGYLVVVSRKLEDPLSILILSQSGAGKSGLTELLERLTPPEEVVLFSRLTPQALYYMEKDFLCRKVVIIEERAGSEEADYSLRTLQSRKKLVLGVPVKDPRTGKIKTAVIEVKGPAVFLETSTSLTVNHENSTRCFELFLDESAEQTRRIHAEQRRRKTLEGQREVAAVEKLLHLHWNVQRLLKPVRVHIPYADLITFPDTWLRTRRDHLRFLNLIEASAFLAQYQRPAAPGASESEPVIEATVEDYRVAYTLARELLGSTLADVRKPAQELLEAMRSLVLELGGARKLPPERVALSRRELRERTGLPDHQVRRLLAEIVSLEHVEQVRGSQGKLCLYRLPAAALGAEHATLAGLLTPGELAKRLLARPKVARL